VTGGKKRITVTWKKQTAQTTGYQIQYSTSSNFKNAKTVTVRKNRTTKKTITGLKNGKKYYVRVRTYKTVKTGHKSTKYYSNWSNRQCKEIGAKGEYGVCFAHRQKVSLCKELRRKASH